MTSEAEVRAALRAWIAARSRTLEPELTDTTPILERRLITSLQIMDLILYVEHLSGRAIDVRQLRPGAFRDVESIYARFFAVE